MLKYLMYHIIGKAYAQAEEAAGQLIPCKDGTYADPAVGCVSSPDAIVNAQSDLLNIILKSADVVVTIAVAGAVIAILYGGIIYTLSMGNEEKVKSAKNILFWSVFGLIVALLAKYIVTAVLIFIT